jgi:hypothetical protein
MPSPYPNYQPAMNRGAIPVGAQPYYTGYAQQTGIPGNQTYAAGPTPSYGPVQSPAYNQPIMPNGPVMNGLPVPMQGPMVGPDGTVISPMQINGQGQMMLQGPMNGPNPMSGMPMMPQGPMMGQGQAVGQGINPNQGSGVGYGPMMGQYPGPGPGMMMGQCQGGCPGPAMPPGACPNGACGQWNGWTDNGEGYWDNGGFGGCNGFPGPGGGCLQDGKMWASAEVLLWWIRGQNLPPLVTSGTSAANPGILGQPGTVILYGNGAVDQGLRVGGRWSLGCWLDECQTIGLDANFFFLGERDENFIHFGKVGEIIGRPFFNINPAVNALDAEQINVPGILAGDVTVSTCSQVYGAEANLRRCLCCNCCSKIELIGGFRYLHLDECVDIQETLTNLDIARGAIGEGFLVDDEFSTVNNFYGGQIGLAGQWRSGCFFSDWRALVALGATTKTITIAGSTTFLDPVAGGNPVTQPGGLLAQPSNIGTFTATDFSIVPQIDLNLGYQFTPLIRGWVGYSFIYWTNVARAGDQIDLNVDGRQIPTRAGPGTGTAPAFVLHNSDFWAMGISLGVSFRY